MSRDSNTNDARLILVSNRLPIKSGAKDGKQLFVESDGGLVSSIRSYFENDNEPFSFRERIWVGAADFSRARWDKFTSSKRSFAYRIEPLFLEERLADKYYNGFCNATLWPLFHYFPSFADFDTRTFDSYEEVNRMFCDRILEILQPGDIVWVHDYHLMLLPGMIRKKVSDVSIGFFLHIPFPAYDVFRIMHAAWKEKIIHGLLGADLLGFHTHEYVQHFLRTMRMVSGFDHRYREIHTNTRVLKADVFPLGIDFRRFNNAGSDPAVQQYKYSIAEKFGAMRILFSVDRLDYTKGVTHRLSGFEKFLELFPEWRGKVVFIMVVVPSRQIVSKYSERRKLIEEQVGRINGKYSTLEWQPLIYRYSQVGFEELCALYRAAHVALITPLRDGMNLVAKEYVASRVEQDGVLILSELAGAANELAEAVLVNPTDRDEVARAIHDSLQMPLEDQVHNMALMQTRLMEKDVQAWVRSFLGDLRAIGGRQQEIYARDVDEQLVRKVALSFQSAEKRLLLLDYDGTLMPIEQRPDQCSPTEEVLEILRALVSRQGTEVVIISGRDFMVLEKWLGELPVNIVGEHGASYKMKGQAWRHHTDIDHSWKAMVRSTFELYTSRSPGSFVEEKLFTIAWHYRGMNVDQGFTRSRELLDNLYHLIRNSHLSILDGNRVIEVRAAGIDKGVATKKMIELYPSDFILAMGDDKTDEDIFSVLNGQSVSIKVGPGMTAAKYRVENQRRALRLLLQLSKTREVLQPEPGNLQ